MAKTVNLVHKEMLDQLEDPEPKEPKDDLEDQVAVVQRENVVELDQWDLLDAWVHPEVPDQLDDQDN